VSAPAAGLELLEFTPHQKGRLLGYACFRLVNNGLIIRKCAVLETDDGLLVKMPEHMEGDGDRKRWTQTVDFVEEPRRQQFQRHAGRLLQIHLQGAE